MLLSYSLTAASLAVSFVSARPLPHILSRQAAVTNFGSCNATPDIVFALGLDGRKDPSFQAKNNNVFNHGSALGVGVITSFICQQLNDRCKAPAATIAACMSGQAAAAKVTGGAAADAFNAAFGIKTNFGGSGANAAVPSAPSSTTPSTTSAAASTCAAVQTVTVTVDPPKATSSTPCPPPNTVTVTVTPAANVAAATPAPVAPPTSASSLNFGSCTNPTIEFGPAFEGRKAAEFSNKPVDKTQFAQGSALNIDIVTRAICDILANKCKAPQATLDACAKGQAAASAATAKSGAQADAFNGALGFQTNFATVPAAPGGGPGSVALATTPNFGSCTNPTMQFGVGFDGRTQASFQPANKTSFNHGSALNPAIIATAICDTFVNSCNANKPAIDNCAAAKAAITGLTGQAVADTFNAAVLKGAPA